MKASERRKKRVVIALSGGVDSSAAAAILKAEGHEVIGISMQLYDHSKLESEGTRFDSCCSLREVDVARRAAQILDIPYYVLNFEKVFQEKVVDYFIKEYLEARTPNPCVKCNEDVKFKHLIVKARELNADYLATGHYAKVVQKGNDFQLHKAKDRKKDQSYFLFSVAKKELPFLLFPLGDLQKTEVREIARQAKLPNADKKESMEICFIPNNDYASFISKEVGPRNSGDIISKEGHKLGQHDGFFQYTVGQRRGLGVSSPDPLYVLNVDKTSKSVTVGKPEDLWATGLMAKEINWITLPSSDTISVRIRYRHQEIESVLETGWQASLEVGNDRTRSTTLNINFSDRQRAVAPGQAAVFYEGDILLGGGWIEKSCH